MRLLLSPPCIVVLFHGMGDTADSEGYVRLQPACESNTSRMRWVKDQIVATYPGTFVHSIRIGPDEQLDRISTMYDNLNRQVRRPTLSSLEDALLTAATLPSRLPLWPS